MFSISKHFLAGGLLINGYVVAFNPRSIVSDRVRGIAHTVYDHWVENWTEFSARKDYAFNSDPFFYADFVYALVVDDQVIASQSYIRYDFSNPWDSGESFVNPYVELLRGRAGNKAFWYMYSISLTPKYRVKVGTIPTLPLFGNLIIKTLPFLKGDHFFAIGNKEAGVDKFIRRFGATTLIENFRFRNSDTSFLVYEKPNFHFWGNKKVMLATEEIWENRIIDPFVEQQFLNTYRGKDESSRAINETIL